MCIHILKSKIICMCMCIHIKIPGMTVNLPSQSTRKIPPRKPHNFRKPLDKQGKIVYNNIKEVCRGLIPLNELMEISEETQYDLQIPGDRSVCLDVLAKDGSGRLFNIEVQRADANAGAKRARYHSSAMFIDSSEPGCRFEELPDTYVIFVTENDVRRGNRAVYTYEKTDAVTGEPFGDGEHIIYINGAYFDSGDSSELAKLIHDFKCTASGEMYLEKMAERLRLCKETEKGVSGMCKLWEDRLKIEADVLAEKIAEERAVERAEERAEAIAINFLKIGKLSVDEVAICSGIQADRVAEPAKTA